MPKPKKQDRKPFICAKCQKISHRARHLETIKGKMYCHTCKLMVREPMPLYDPKKLKLIFGAAIK